VAHFCISYDLIDRKDYAKLIKELTRLGAHKALLSVWLMDYEGTTADLLKHLSGFIDSDDKLIAIRLHWRPRYRMAIKGTDAWCDARTWAS